MASESTALYEITRDIPRYITSERLPFVLPDFSRHAWTSESARSLWEPRISRILRAWLDVEWLSVAAGTRTCGLLWVLPGDLPRLTSKWETAQLSAIPLEFGDYPGGNSAPASVSGMICIVVGALGEIERLREAWRRSDDDVIGALLGYPACCRAFFRDVWVAQGCLDTTWAMAENTCAPTKPGTVRIELPPEVRALANILWRWLGVRAVPHLPCRFDCSASIEFGQRLLEVARSQGYSEEADWIAEILTWPAEWSALHGIAEIKSPLTKLSTRTDATSGKWIVQWVGTKYPKEGAVGLHFPFQPPRRQVLTVSPKPPPGLDDSGAEDPSPSWRYADNGFASFAAMEELHKPIVSLAREALVGASGNVLDLGCGNGMLLKKVCAGHSALVPHGIDGNEVALGHARQLMPNFAGNFVQGDLFDIEFWGPQHYTMALLMLGRLLEAPRERAMRVLNCLRESCSQVLGYVYPDWGERTLEAIAHDFGLEVVASPYQNIAFLKLPQIRESDLGVTSIRSPRTIEDTQDLLLPNVDTTANTIRVRDREVEILLTVKKPRIVLLGNILSDDECDELAEYCEPRLERSEVVGDPEGTVQVNDTRTSRGVMLHRGETNLVKEIEARLAALAQWPVERSEGLQVMRYDATHEYRAHFDWIDPNLPGLRQHLEHGGQRLGTFILYLSKVESGGSTSFPSIGLEVVPRKGGALFFLNTDSHFVPDELTLHAGRPVVKGVKFIANKWLRQSAC